MDRPILITGSSGYLAGFVIEALRPLGPLRLLDRVEPTVVPDGGRFQRADITDLAALRQAMQGCRAVVHLVALVRGRHERSLDDFLNVMVRGTWNVFEAAVREQVPRVVNVSSIVAGRFGGDRLSRADEPAHYGKADLFYALSKVLGEEIGRAYHVAHGLAVVHIRPGIIAGDGANPGPRAPERPTGPWFLYVDPRDVAGAVAQAVRDDAPAYGIFPVVADRRDTAIDLTPTLARLGYRPQYNWPEIPETESPT